MIGIVQYHLEILQHAVSLLGKEKRCTIVLLRTGKSVY
jgi:hypothetical protein